MSYVHGFENDIFISYARVDNMKAEQEEFGWVDLFQERLDIELSGLIGKRGEITIWRDLEQIDGSEAFNDVLKNRINQSALFLSLTSHAYLESEYCRNELTWFYEKAQKEPLGLKIGERVRIFNVLLRNIPHENWPQALAGTSGFPFNDAKKDDDEGYPLTISNKIFLPNMRKLAEALYKTLKAIQKKLKEQKVTSSEPPEPPDESPDVFVAEAADLLRPVRKRVISDLEQKGIKVYKKIPPPYESDKHEEAVIKAMKETMLSVHLLDGLGGSEIEGEEETTYLRKQVELGKDNARAQLIWVPRSLKIDEIDDGEQQKFIENLENDKAEDRGYDFIRGAKNDISHLIIEKLEILKEKSKQPEVTSESGVLLDINLKDQPLILDMWRFLCDNNIEVHINSQKDDPKCNINILKETLKQVKVTVIVYGGVDEDWVISRLFEAVKIGTKEKLSNRFYYVYLAPPAKPDKPFDAPFRNFDFLDNSRGFNPDKLTPLLNTLTGGST